MKYFKYKILLRIFLFTFIIFFLWFLIPCRIDDSPASTIITDNKGNLLGAKIAADGQWRFPKNDSINPKFENAIIEFEDKWFYKHPGINPVSLYRSFILNWKANKIVSGGSTISMQLVRLTRGKKRNYYQKFIEMVLALRIELMYSKKEILSFYASSAPFGSNVVGLEAAAWRYFGCSPNKLSWAEAAMLAVLPNAPSMIHPGKNRDVLLIKRNRLLHALWKKGCIDSITCYLSQLEPIPDKPHRLPALAPHILEKAVRENPGKVCTSTLSASLQEKVMDVTNRHMLHLRANQIFNAAVLVINNHQNTVMAYMGNVYYPNNQHASFVDIIEAPRSTGSILKPFLFAAMLDEGKILPGTLIPDIPTQIAGFKPENYDLTYDGAVPAKRALARSLNIPAVRLLHDYGIPPFYTKLKKLGMTTLRFPADHYGLTLILGGAEGSLWDITSIYSSMARVLNHYYTNDGTSYLNDFSKPVYDIQKIYANEKEIAPIIGAAAIWNTFESLIEVNRPEEESSWKEFSSKNRIAWKTGTSYGFRDAWAIGVTPEYTVGVWVGNASGEGRPGLTGVGSAAPILFDIFGILPSSTWFHQPQEEMHKIAVCHHSGFRAGIDCENVDSIWVPEQGIKTRSCPYHRMVHLSDNGKYRVNSRCESVSKMIHKKWFVLPPVMEWYYAAKNPLYVKLPPWKSECIDDENPMDIIYPRELTRVFLPKGMDGGKQVVVFEVAHRNPHQNIFWHLDGEYVATTYEYHKQALSPSKGKHTLVLVDEEGNSISRIFEVLE